MNDGLLTPMQCTHKNFMGQNAGCKVFAIEALN